METATATQTKWTIDPAHSEILFTVKHLMITNIKGEFRKFTAEVTTLGHDITTASVHVSIDASSVFTNDDKRDTHLKSADFFDIENVKEITFESASIKHIKDAQYEMKGMLSIRGTAKEITLAVEFGGLNKDPWGQEKAGFSVTGKINRKDWGLNWNAALETGGVLVSDEVKINAEVQFIKQAS
jgi:polyisoprenoid-binding protein YceI